MMSDVRYALRSLRRTPGFTFVVLATLAIGIGANTAMFSVVNAVLLKPFPYADVDTLLRIRAGTSYMDLTDIAARVTSISGAAAHRAQFFDYSTGSEAERLDGVLVTGNMLPVLGAQPLLGRLIVPADDHAGAPRVAVLSSNFWRSHLGGDPGVIGRALTLNGQAYTIVGVLPPSFHFPLAAADIVAPFLPEAGPEATARGAHSLAAFVRLKAGATRGAAQEELNALGEELARQYPRTNNDVRFRLEALRQNVTGNVQQPLVILLATVGFVLLIACVNVANLLIARGASRRTELAIRAAIGATRGRIVRQVLTESLLLSAAGGALGLTVAWWLMKSIVAVAPEDIPRLATAAIDGPVLAFALLVSLATGLAFGTLPAWASAASSVADAARAGTRGTRGGNRSRSILLVAEVALALVLVVGAGLLLKSFSALMAQAPGFETGNLLTGNVILNGPRYTEVSVRTRFWDEAESRLRQLPGVRDVAITTDLPIGGQSIFHNLAFEGREMAPGTEPEVYYRGVNEAYFRAMGIPLLKGRTFTTADRAGAPLVAVVNDAFVREYFRGEEPLGRRIRWASGDGTWITIVGVVADVRGLSLDQGEVPAVHMPYAQEINAWRRWMDVGVRTDANAIALAPLLRRELLAIDRNVPVAKVRTMEDVLAASVAERRFSLLLLGSFAAIALVLAAAGTYGVMAYLVMQRTREIGVRLAVGARPADVFRLVVGRGLALALVGVVLGLAAAAMLSRTLETMLFNVAPTDAITFAAAAAVLLGAAAAASVVPARRAARMDPLEALRSE
jgi:putative ABC transport system permease protein